MRQRGRRSEPWNLRSGLGVRRTVNLRGDMACSVWCAFTDRRCRMRREMRREMRGGIMERKREKEKGGGGETGYRINFSRLTGLTL